MARFFQRQAIFRLPLYRFKMYFVKKQMFLTWNAQRDMIGETKVYDQTHRRLI
jgi:hypothetical protein